MVISAYIYWLSLKEVLLVITLEFFSFVFTVVDFCEWAVVKTILVGLNLVKWMCAARWPAFFRSFHTFVSEKPQI